MNQIKKINLQNLILKDERGWVINPLEIASLPRGKLGNLHVVSIEPGIIRGNHYHTSATEWILVYGGSAKIAWRSRGENQIHEDFVGEKELALFEIQKNVEHSIKNNSKKELIVMSFNDAFDRGTVKCPSLLSAR